MAFMNKNKDGKAAAPKKEKAPKQKKEKKTKAPKDPNAPEKNIFGQEKKASRAELQAEIDRLNQEIAYKNGELAQLKNWARSAPVH